MSYAVKTSVPVERSQGEIRKILAKYGASGFAFGEQGDFAVVMFEMAGRRIKFILPLSKRYSASATQSSMTEKLRPEVKAFAETLPSSYRSMFIKAAAGDASSSKTYEQLRRTRWRCLVLAIKAKLECVESGITTLEQEFMAHIVLPNGATVGQVMIPQIAAAYENKQMPPLLGHSK